jgi:outer membrane protein assembly factor BamB
MHVLKPGKTKMEELHVQRFRPREGVGFVETNGTPAVANGKMYFGTLESFYCIGTKNGKAGSPPAQPAEDKSDDKISHIQVLPADVVLPPGGSAEFSVKFFNSRGVQLDVKPDDGKWDIVLPPKQPDGRQPPKIDGELMSEGLRSKLTVSKMLTGQQGYVEFVLDPTGRNAHTGRARVRVAPQLPYKQDFEKVPVGAAPGGWVNTMGKFNVIELGGSKVLRKIANNPAPPVARANGYIGLPDLNNYTIQADVSAQGIRDGLPDIGLLNCRYHLILDGKQDLRITSWEAKPRINHGIPFNWKPSTWYTMVLTVEQTKDKATIRGKVWPRGETEPGKWTIEFEDPSPNREGAPAIYAYISNVLGNQPGSEAYFDNVSVIPNGKK